MASLHHAFILKQEQFDTSSNLPDLWIPSHHLTIDIKSEDQPKKVLNPATGKYFSQELVGFEIDS